METRDGKLRARNLAYRSRSALLNAASHARKKQRAVLAVLLLNANHVVSTEQLIDDLWGDSPPSTARNSVQVYVAALRKALSGGGASLHTRAPGYVLELDAGASTWIASRSYARRRESPPIAERRAALLHEALLLWRDAPLPELRTEPFATQPSHSSSSCGSRRSRSASTPTSPSAVMAPSSRSSSRWSRSTPIASGFAPS